MGGGGPESVTQFLYCRDTAGPPLWVGVVGPKKKDAICPARLPGKGGTAFDRTAASLEEGRKMVIPLPGGGSKGGGGREGQDIGPTETEYGRAIYCDIKYSGALQSGGEATGDTCPTAVVGTVGNRLESGEGESGSGSGEGNRKHGRVRDTGLRSGSGIGTSPHARVDRGRHQGGGVPKSQWFQRGGVEREGGLSPSDGH